MTVKIDHNSGKDPSELVLALVSGQAFPFKATLNHSNVFPLVVPATGYTDVIQPGTEAPVRIASRDQAWNLICDLSAFAERANNESEDFAVLTLAMETSPPKTKAAKAAVTTTKEAV